MVDHNTPPLVRRHVLLGKLQSLRMDIDHLASIVSGWRDETVDRPDKPDYRAITRRLEKALEQIELALERLPND